MLFKMLKESDKFTMVPNEFIRDLEITGLARWLLIYIMSFSDNFEASIPKIAEDQQIGKDTIASKLKELEGLGYIYRYKKSLGRGKIINYCIASFDPHRILEFTSTVNIDDDNPPPQVLKKEVLSTKERKTNTNPPTPQTIPPKEESKNVLSVEREKDLEQTHTLPKTDESNANNKPDTTPDVGIKDWLVVDEILGQIYAVAGIPSLPDSEHTQYATFLKHREGMRRLLKDNSVEKLIYIGKRAFQDGKLQRYRDIVNFNFLEYILDDYAIEWRDTERSRRRKLEPSFLDYPIAPKEVTAAGRALVLDMCRKHRDQARANNPLVVK